MLLHSLKFDIRSRSIEFGDWPDRIYRSNDLTQVFPDHVASLSLEVERAGSSDALDIEAIDATNGTFAEIPLSGGMCFYRDGRFYSECEGEFSNRVEFIPESSLIRMNIGGRFLEVPPSGLLGLVVKPIMQSFVLPFYHLKSLHGAVVARGDKTIMISGRGGAGKSTTALRLMLADYALLADDTALFTTCGDHALALSSLDSAHAAEATIDLLPRLRDGIIGDIDHRGKYSISLQTLQPNNLWREPRRVTHFVHLSRKSVTEPRFLDDNAPHATAALLGEAMTVFRSGAFAGNEMFERHSRLSFDVITSLIRDSRVLTLEFDNHHLENLPKLFDTLQ
ncbi:MAG TPA: hypothetical protein VM053_02825 [Gemmatimonadaceae bacterium]|nr:hypothetical protein [Gemmatimonadaceae bacterium]